MFGRAVSQDSSVRSVVAVVVVVVVMVVAVVMVVVESDFCVKLLSKPS